VISACRAGFTQDRRYPQPYFVIHKKYKKTVLSNDYVAKSLILLDHKIKLETRHFGGFQVAQNNL
jgi:hypothetical protein